LIHRDESKIGGDFVGYIKDIQVIFDQAVLERETIIDDEALWQIRTEEESARRNAELQRLGNRRVLEALEVDKKATEFFDPSTGTVINELTKHQLTRQPLNNSIPVLISKAAYGQPFFMYSH
jgi:hypothetical protein